MTEQVLHDMKRMLNLGANAGLGMFEPFQQTAQGRCRQRFAFTWPHRHVPRHRALNAFFPLLDALVTGIPKSIGFVAVEQGLGLRHVADMACRADYGVNQSGLGIDLDMSLHAEVPLLALLALVHRSE